VREYTLLIERSAAFGQLKPTKTGQTRTGRLLGPLADTLAAWREATPRSTPTDLVFPAPDGSPWGRERMLNWRKRAFADSAAAAGVPEARPYEYADVRVMPMSLRRGCSARFSTLSCRHNQRASRNARSVSEGR
jgi:hypothetical protein